MRLQGLEPCASIVAAVQIAAERREQEGEAAMVAAGREQGAQRITQEDRDLGRAVGGDPGKLVADGRVGEAAQDRVAIGPEVHASGCAQQRDHVAVEKGVQVTMDRPVRERLVDEPVAGEQGRVGQHAVGGVEHPQLDLLVRRHLVAELDADPLQRRPAGAEPVLDHPLDEVLGKDWCLIVHTATRVEPRRIVRGDTRRDAIHHAAGEGDVGLDPGGELWIARARERQHAAADHLAIVLEVVAGQDGVRARPGGAATLQAGDDEAEHGAGCFGVGEIVGDVRRVEPELAGRLVQIVAALGDRQGDDPGRRVARAAPARHQGPRVRTGTRRCCPPPASRARRPAGTG